MTWFTETERDAYRTHGHIVAHGALSAELVASLKAEVERIALEASGGGQAFYYFENSTVESGVRLLRRVERLSSASGAVDRLLRSSEISGRVSELLGEPAVLFKDKLNMKLPGGAGFRPHVDGHFLWADDAGREHRGWLDYSERFINATIPLDSSRIENGCLQVASLQDTFRFLGRDFDTILGTIEGRGPEIRTECLAGITMQPVQVEPGDVVFFDWRCVHSSEANHSSLSRRTIYSTYNPLSDGDRMDAYYAGKRGSTEPLARKALG